MTEHPDDREARRRPRNLALGLALGYVVLGGLYIGLSDRLVAGLGLTAEQLTSVQSYKGWAYVALTGALLYGLVYRFLAVQGRANRELRAQRDRLLELNRVQGLLRAINATLLRVNDEELLLAAACRAIVEEGGFPYAWIGRVAHGPERLERVAWAGADPGPEAPVTVPLDGERSTLTHPLFDGQPRTQRAPGDPWLERLAPVDVPLGAVLVLPLRTADGIIGVVVIHAREDDWLDDPEERRLLTEVADNVALGIGYMRQRHSLLHRTYHDDLTGIGNRLLVENRLVAALNKAEQRGAAVGILVLDVDRFRETNDTGGRGAGDRVLQATAQILSGVIRPGDAVGRLGNDEFAVLFVDLPSPELVSRLAGRVVDRFPERIDADGLDVYLTVSIGVAIYPVDGTNARDLLARAEIALHSQADDQTGVLTYYAPEFDRRARERRDLEVALRSALHGREFEIAWQPIVDIASGRTVAGEALLRWHNPRLGAVPPDRFIPVAEQTGLIVSIGAWVIEEACARAAAWANDGRPVDVAVNVALQQLQDPAFVAQVRRALQRHPPDGWRLVLELTESEFMADPHPVVAACRSLKDMGCAIHVDDFGTGYSALTYLTHLPLDGLKIDRSFVAQVEADRGVQAITRAVLALAAGLELDVIAEGVETEQQLSVVRDLGCTQVQGFLLGRPMPADAFGEHLHATRGRAGTG